MAQRDSPYTSRDVAVLIVGVPLGIAWIVSIVGLYCFWRIARPLTVLTWIMILIVEAVSGPSIDLGIVNSLFQLDALLGGIIIAVIYLPPAKAWFEKRAEVSSAIPAQAAPS